MRHLLACAAWCVVLTFAGCSEKPVPTPRETSTPASVPDSQVVNSPREHTEADSTAPNREVTPPELSDPLDREIIRWFDTLGFPDLANRKLVRLRLPYWSETVDARFPRPLAFLLSEDDKSFKVFSLSLFESSYVRTRRDESGEQSTRFDVVDLRQEANAFLKLMRTPESDVGMPRSFGRQVSERVEAVVIARGCAANGLGKEAHELLVEAASITDPRVGNPRSRQTPPTALAGRNASSHFAGSRRDGSTIENLHESRHPAR